MSEVPLQISMFYYYLPIAATTFQSKEYQSDS